MPKAKTHRGTAKRIKVTKMKKLLKKTASQNHFNAREEGSVTRSKRRLQSVAKADAKNIRRSLHI
ncbi:50S ribosomal protein L35 [Patescibacteria group bacterium]|nr:50S ribosomal protein L35 [Patescibacteria group bacterium]